MEQVEHIHRNADNLKLKVIKGQKESYGWEISITGSSNLDIIRAIQETDAELRTHFGPKAKDYNDAAD